VALADGFSVVQDHGQEGAVHLEATVVLDESQLAELVHEEIDASPGGAIISASVSCEIFGSTRCGFESPYRAISSSVLASRFSLELNN
jgi:hypothetical protein